jgi:hypothetical protein
MADNVTVSQGQLSVATVQDRAGVQHQKMANEFLSSAGDPINVATGAPMPVDSPTGNDLMFSILVELRILNQLIYTLVAPESEPIELLRDSLRQLPSGSMVGASTIPGA